MATRGVIYILTNPAFPEYVKIGYANDLERRMKDFNQNEALPFAFRVYAIYEVYERLTDKKLHDLIDTLNPDLRTVENFDGKERKREFYAMSKEDAYKLLECIAKISGTEPRLKRMKPTGHEVLDEQVAQEVEENARRSPLRFSMCGLKQGDFVTFKNDESIKVKIADDRHLEYNNEIMSCSALARKLLGLPDNAVLAGTDYFMYDGMALPDLRKKFESKHEQNWRTN